jgi:thiol-disulfide isomerase/thioredoxin
MSRFFFFLPLFLIAAICSAQNRYYNLGGTHILNENQYTAYLDSYSKSVAGIDITNLKVEVKGDSIIYHNRLLGLPARNGGKAFNPFASIKKLISKTFPLSNFKGPNSVSLDNNLILGKPTLIHFWFTRCPPCIKEIPTLNRLKNKYSGRVNFVAITFESRETVNSFQGKHPLQFWHITDSFDAIDELGVSGYPANIVVDKNGIVKFAFGAIHSQEDMELVLDDLLQKQ